MGERLGEAGALTEPVEAGPGAVSIGRDSDVERGS